MEADKVNVKKKGISLHIKHGHPDKGYRIKEILIGHRSFIALLGFIVGAHLAGRSLWEAIALEYGLLITGAIGVIIFLVSGLVLHEFRDVRDIEERENIDEQNA